MGHFTSRKDVEIDQKKTEAITKIKPPQNKKELQRFLGIIVYLAKFIPNLSDKTLPLKVLLSKRNEWRWTSNEQRSFNKLKTLITITPVLSYSDQNK